MKIFCLLVAAILSFRTEAVSYTPSNGETLRNVLLTQSGSVIVGSTTSLRKLDLNLEVLQTVPLQGGEANRLLAGDPGGTYDDSFMSCAGLRCELLSINNITNRQWQGNTTLLEGSLNALGLFVTGHDGHSVFTAALMNDVRASRLLRGRLVGVGTGGSSFDRFARQDEAGQFILRKFLSVFKHEEYSYYINQLRIEMEDQVRMVRLCNNDNHTTGFFESYFEIHLECGGSNRLPTGATFIPVPSPLGTTSIVVTVSSPTENHACVYNLTEIHSLMTEKYESCRDGDGLTGLLRDGREQCRALDNNQLNNPDINECNLRSTLLPAQEVASPLTTDPVFSHSLSSGQFSSILHTTVDTHHFIFAGTDNGKLYQFYIESRESIPLIHTFDLVTDPEVGVANVTQLTVTSDGLTLYALTPSKLISHSVDVCDTYKSCDSCLDSGDPICGWCTLENRCSRQADCNAESSVWVYDSMNSCPVISSVTPTILYIKDLEDHIDLTTSNMPDVEYKCNFNFLSNSSEQQSTGTTVVMEMTSPATKTGDMFTCPVPTPTSLPPLPHMEDALLSNISLHYNGNNVVTFNEPIRFADCSVHDSCTSCIKTLSQCSWCPFTFKCIAPSIESCNGDGEETPVNDSCPKLLPPNTSSNYFLHTNYMYGENPLIINAENLENFEELFSKREFKCVVKTSEEMELFRMEAVLGGNPFGSEVECQQRQFNYDYDGDESEVHAILDVEWTTVGLAIDNPNKTGVTLYSCGRLGTNCAQCLSLDANYQCQVCDHPNLPCSLGPQCGEAFITDPTNCDLPVISSISPNSGPPEGGTTITVMGTNLGVAESDIVEVTINDVSCDVNNQLYQPGVSFTCVTGPTTNGSYAVVAKISYLSDRIISQDDVEFSYKDPSIDSMTPKIGPRAGGTLVTIVGSNLDVGSSRSVRLVDLPCDIIKVEEGSITCNTSAADSERNGSVSVAIDNWEHTLSETFEYLPNPEFDSISPQFSFADGGTAYMIDGKNLDTVREPRLLLHLHSDTTQSRRRRESANTIKSEPCMVQMSGTRLNCSAPAVPLLPTVSQQTATIGLMMDGVSELVRIEGEEVVVHANPRFRTFDESFSSNEEIHLTVQSEELEFVFTATMVEVLVTPCKRDICPCVDITISQSNMSFTCIVQTTASLDQDRELTVTVHIGNFSQNVGTLIIEKPNTPNPWIIVAPISVIFVAGVVVFAAIVVLLCYRAREKDSRYNQLIVEMEKLESSVARECKLGFAELQTDLDELTGDISGQRLPYRDLQVYLLSSLFPGSKDHPVLHPVQLPLKRQISTQRAIKDFHDLCMDKKVLLIFIRTLEEQRSFTIRDKSLVGSLLMVALHQRLDYATEILKTLLSDLIHRAISKSNPKLLLRRTESVAEKMLTNWLAFCLHGYIVECAGKPLYLLYRAVKSQLEKGPIDVITGEARYSLSEHKLIRQKMDVEVLTVTVEADDGIKVPVKVLNCDTISQVKEKILDSVYKATPVSKRPDLTSVDLEYLKSPREYKILRDEDMSMVTDMGWKRLNTLQHYEVEDGAAFRLMKRHTHAPPGRAYDYPASLISSHAVRKRALSEAEDGTRVWHLFKQQDVEDPRRSPFMNKKMITEIYLPRMLSTKNILQKFVDDLFSSLFSVTQPPISPSSPLTYSNFSPMSPGMQGPPSYAPGGTVPMAVKYILDFLDDAAERNQIHERDVVHMWKNNALALRFWVNLMKNPEFVFDINKSHTVDACLSVIAQAFIDGCSFTDVKLTIDSPTSKLLYNKEVQGYKTKVRQYYQNVARLPRIPEDAMQSYLKQLSEHHAQVFGKNGKDGRFVVESALFELLRYGNRYHDELLTNLREAGLDARAQVFESVVRATM